jgi:hypothetical protein
MRKALLWVGAVLCAIGLAVIGASAHLGFGYSINLGDPARFQFILVPIWQIGLGSIVVGAILLWAARRQRSAPP